MKNFKLLDEPGYKLNRDDNLQMIRNDIRKHIKRAYEQNCHQYNIRRAQSFQVGQEILRRNFVQSSAEKGFNAKLAPLFVKAKVREKLGKNYYILEDQDGKLVGTFHAKDLRE